jgi:two-component system, chemotaxis family, sensor kinase CheA
MQELEKKHRQFHELVRDVIGLHAKGDKASAERGLSGLEPMSADIISLLSLVEQKVLEAQNVNIVVLRADDRIFGLIVDEINDTEEIVVKPLGKQLKSINTYAGATIMGDGKVALILDVLGLAQRANIINEMRDRSVVDTEEKDLRRSSASGQRKTLLLFQLGGSGRIAIELSLVARLEEFPRDAVEIGADQEVVQYRGQIMPLIHISGVLESTREKKSAAEREALHVVVYTHNGRSVGLVVDYILDTVDEAFVMQPQSGRKGIMGSAVIQKRVPDILDLPALIAAAAGNDSYAAVHA